MSNLIYWPQVAGPIANQNALSHDPYFSSVSILGHFDGTNGSTTYVNSAPTGISINHGGSDALSTTSPLFGSASLLCAGSGSFPTCSSSALVTMGMGDFTLEIALKTGTPSQAAMLIDIRTGGVTVSPAIYITGSSFRYYVNGVDRITGGTVATSTWQRIAVAKISGTTRMFLDGTQIGSNYSDSNNYLGAILAFGGDSFNSLNGLTGNLDEARITKGVGRYSSNYSVATAPFPNQ